MKRITTGVAALAAAVALAVLPSASTGQTAGGEKGCSLRPQRNHGTFEVTFRPRWDGHKPRHWRKVYDRDAKRRQYDAVWPITVTARRNGKAIAGRIYYQFLAFGKIQACRTVKSPARPRFRGTFRDVIQWPRKSVLLPLTFRVVVRTKYGVKNIDYEVSVQPRK